jgi:hypothetical protein
MDWHQHVHYTHSLPSYLFFIIQIKHKKPNECNELEKTIKAMIERENMTWLPR